MVAIISNQIDPKGRLSKEELFDQTAKAVRSRIAELRKGGGSKPPLPLEGQGGSSRTKKGNPAQTLSEIDAYLAERKAGMNKKASSKAYDKSKT